MGLGAVLGIILVNTRRQKAHQAPFLNNYSTVDVILGEYYGPLILDLMP